MSRRGFRVPAGPSARFQTRLSPSRGARSPDARMAEDWRKDVPVTGLSYVHGSSGPALVGAAIGDFLDDVAESHGDREAMVCVAQDQRFTYRELRERAETFAAGLIELGLEPGERIGIWSPNRAEWVV